MTKFKDNIKQAIRDMEVGQKIDFPIEKLETVRVLSSNVGAMLRRTYSTSRSDNGEYICVTRIK